MNPDDSRRSTTAVRFFVNGTPHRVEQPDPRLLLVDYLRRPDVGLTGTKRVCGEAGCGACTVLASRTDGVTGRTVRRAINSCVHRVCQLDGVDVTTIEAIGSARPPVGEHTGLDPIQRTLAERNGSQCGFCTPGWVMSMHGLLEAEPAPTAEQIERHFDGNLCRCTGYRPILDAMHAFDDGRGAPPCLAPPPPISPPDGSFSSHARGRSWHQVTSIAEIRDLPATDGAARRLIAANTSQAIVPAEVDGAHQLIDITGIQQLQRLSWDTDAVTVGAGITLAEFMTAVDRRPDRTDDRYAGLREFRTHLDRVANAQVRNVATLGGNVMLTVHQTGGREPFPSDVVLMAIGMDADIGFTRIADLSDHHAPLRSFPQQLDATDRDVVVTSLRLPHGVTGDRFSSAKITRRPQNSHAIVNMCCRVNLDEQRRISRTRLVLGGIGPWPIVLDELAPLLDDHQLTWDLIIDPAVHDTIVDAVERSLSPGAGVPDEARVVLAANLVFRALTGFLVDIDPDAVPAASRRVGPLERRVSVGSVSFPRITSEAPVGKAMPALPAPLHASGEARYTHDLPWPPRTLHAAYVYSCVRHARFRWAAPSKQEVVADLARRFPGVVDVVDVDDVPVTSENYGGSGGDDPVFASGTVTSYGMPIALVLANDPGVADEAATFARAHLVEYTDLTPVVTTIDEALALPDDEGQFSGTEHPHIGDLTRPGSDESWLFDPRPVEGEVFAAGRQRTGGQNHFYLETQSALVVPDEPPELVVYASTQSPASLQRAIAGVLGIDDAAVTVEVTRLGGGYGGKETRPPFFAAAAAVAASKWRRPVRLVLDRTTDGSMMGGRHPFRGDYWVSARHDGTIDKLRIDLALDGGDTLDVTFPVADLAVLSSDGAYQVPTFEVGAVGAKTNVRTNTAMRSFGGIQTGLVLEDAIEHVAHRLGLRPETVRRANLYPDHVDGPAPLTPYGQPLNYCVMQTSFERLHELADFDARADEVDEFNRVNRWRKQGISLIPLKYGISYTNVSGNQGGALINVNEGDGSISVATGGIEMGQGLTTKMAQIAAFELGVDLSRITTVATDTRVVPNASSTGASTGSDLNGGAVKQAALELRRRLVDFCRTGAENVPDDWERHWDLRWTKIVKAAHSARIDLSSQAWYRSPDLVGVPSSPNRDGHDFHSPNGKPFYYFSYSTACSQVEIDVLTGDVQVCRTDILYDAGQSLNPDLDIGQIRGGFVQGLGNVTTEFVYADSTGAPQTTGTWQYKVPDSLTIPVDFRVHLLSYERTDPHLHVPLDPSGVQSSKSTGEPPLVLANTVFFAIKHAIAAARAELGLTDWFELESPATIDRIVMACAGRAPNDAPDDAPRTRG